MDAVDVRILAAGENLADILESLWERFDRWTRAYPRLWRWTKWLMLLWISHRALCYMCAVAEIFAHFLVQDVNHRPPQVLIWRAPTLPWAFTMLTSDNDIVTSPCPPIGDNVCRVTFDRGFINSSDAIVFDAESLDLMDLPPYRYQNQVWVLFAQGPPQWPLSQDLFRMAPLFDWTMAFRDDADIVLPHKVWTSAFVIPNISKRVTPARGKAKTAVWMISECEERRLEIAGSLSLASSAWSGSERFISTVLDNIDVDVISDCGRRLCSWRHQCLHLLEDEYYFVFVMESSSCFEHPAQLIYDSFSHDIIPVFFGVGDFTHPLPPHTFVDTSKLGDPSEAVDVLRRIAGSPQAYVDFIAQRRGFLLTPPVNSMCALCRALHLPPNKPRHNNSILWWRSRSDCSLYTTTQWSDTNITQSANVQSSTYLE